MTDELQKVETSEVPAKTEGPKQLATRQIDFGPEIEKLLPTVGTIELKDNEKEILYAPVNESQIEIRPDGLIYLSWMRYVTRLRDALGIAWGLIPQGLPRVRDGYMIWPFWFLIRGALVTFVVGEQKIESQSMSWAEAAEGCRSNALMRACKALGVGLQLWDPAFIREWKSKNAKEVDNPKKPGQKMWVKYMTLQEAADKAKEVFPEAAVVDTPGMAATGGYFPSSETPVPEAKSSALMFVEYHDAMVRLNHIFALRDYWTKIAEEAEKKLHPNHFKQLVELKTKLRQGFIDKANQKGGK